MSWFRLGKKLGTKPLRLLVLVSVLVCAMAAVLCGCGASKYEAVDFSVPEVSEEIPTIVLGDVSESGAGADSNLLSGISALAANDSEAVEVSYQETDDYVLVLTDALNVRAKDSTDARIYAQLPAGEILHRIGYNDQWCQVEYAGEVAYVAADMVEVTEAPVVETAESVEMMGDVQVAPASETMEAGVDDSGIPTYMKTGTVQKEGVSVPFNGHIVAIDAGHQAKANAEKEPIGPSSQTMKAKMPQGAVGTVSGVKEYELTLTVAQKLESELKARGYEVVMVRNSHDVNLSDAERAILANDSDAEVFIRLHANSMDNSGVYGAMAMCMTEYNPYNAELSTDSYRLSKLIINNICSRTGTKNRGVQKVDNSSAINWCEIPVSVVEMGFLSNPDEDRWLQSDEYQNKIVAGIVEAVDTYFSES